MLLNEGGRRQTVTAHLSAEQGEISIILQDLGQGSDFPREVAFVAILSTPASFAVVVPALLDDTTQASKVRICACQDHRPSRTASRGRVKVEQSNSVCGEFVKVRCPDLCPEAPDVTEALAHMFSFSLMQRIEETDQVIGDDDEQIGWFRRGCQSRIFLHPHRSFRHFARGKLSRQCRCPVPRRRGQKRRPALPRTSASREHG